MWLVVGLGNPGPAYRNTRHNAGYLVAEQLADGAAWRTGPFGGWCTLHLANQPALLLKPTTYMNRSGLAVGPVMTEHSVGVQRLIVVHDDLDLPFGALRLKLGGGHGGHRGLRSISAELDTADYLRVRFGIGRPERGNVTDYVLGAFDDDETAALSPLLERAAEAVIAIIDRGVQSAANTYNVRPRPAPETDTETKPETEPETKPDVEILAPNREPDL